LRYSLGDCAQRKTGPGLSFLFVAAYRRLYCCQRIKRDPELRTIPVVIVCYQDSPEQPELARKKGCDAWLSKPLDKHSFLQLGRQFLPGVREHRQPTFFRVTILSEGEEFAGKCLDLSGGGMFVESQADLPPGTEF